MAGSGKIVRAGGPQYQSFFLNRTPDPYGVRMLPKILSMIVSTDTSSAMAA